MIKRLISMPFLGLIYIYRWLISPLLPNACRFTPTCSQYAIEAYRIHGVFRASYLVVKRIMRCHPWGEYRFDPVPEKKIGKKD